MNDFDQNQKLEKIQRLVSRSYFYLRFRPRTEKEMHDFLTKKAQIYQYDEEIVEAVFASLRKDGYIDDAKFIESFVASHQLNKQKGTFVLKNELRKKGIAADLISQYFEENPQDESSLAQQVLRKVWSRLRTLEPLKRFKKAHDYLRRRGFSYDITQKTIEEFEQKE